MKIKYSRNALKFLSKLDKKSVDRIRQAVDGLIHIPPEGDIKPLKGYEDGRKRLRVGTWRIIFRFDKQDEIEVLFVIDIGNRGDIY
ncbi:MAG: type II toxin-antitoxin system RelE/ParE family toxin [Clostridia bacterium]|nr:type II toxin-antitoxin system RelE/ParE family toxin [Clostridia bacterium]